jgi:TetR/AcrR family transcriptional repressor of mexCD-oprJ operon
VDAEQRGRAANADSARTLEQMFLHGALSGGEFREHSSVQERTL